MQVTTVLTTSGSHSRSSSITSWDSLHGNGQTTSDPSCRRYSAPLGQEELQQELVVTAVKVKKKKRRRQGGGGSVEGQMLTDVDRCCQMLTDVVRC